MPLNRDHQAAEGLGNMASSTAGETQHGLREVDRNQNRRPSTPLNGMSQSLRRAPPDASLPNSGRRHQLEDAGLNTVTTVHNVHKQPVPNTIEVHKTSKNQQPALTAFARSNRQEGGKTLPPSTVRSKVSQQHAKSVFDDTASFHTSTLEDSQVNEQTTLFNPQRAERSSMQQETRNHDHKGEPRYGEFALQDNQAIAFGPNEQEAILNQRDLLQAREDDALRNNQVMHGTTTRSGPKSYGRTTPRLEYRTEPDTPTRTQSAPPVNDQLHAPAARKNVNFATSDEVYSPSQGFQSSEMEREGSFGSPISRPSSVQPRVQHMVGSGPQPVQKHAHNHPKQGRDIVPMHAGRFDHVRTQSTGVGHQNQKISAPDSDNQDYSEDEPMQNQPNHDLEGRPSEVINNQPIPSTKRSYDDMSNVLDYSSQELEKKTLPALQAEPFTHDPRASRPPTPIDAAGNELTLVQILDNLSKVSEVDQRKIFKNLTDEQWAKTGRWFVDKFQADLKKLTAVRLERRKIAMQFEDKIKRRQCLAECHIAAVNKQLQELQTGGTQLVGGRKVHGGSRAGTPMKGTK